MNLSRNQSSTSIALRVKRKQITRAKRARAGIPQDQTQAFVSLVTACILCAVIVLVGAAATGLLEAGLK